MEKEAVIVIFGCRHQEECLSRIKAAITLTLEKQINPTFIFTGTDSMPFSPNKISELLKDDKMIWENKSTDTESNINNTLEVIGVRIVNRYEIFIVSSWYHIPRIKLFLKRAGVKIPDQNFVKSHSNIKLINVIIEPFALLAAYLKLNRWQVITFLKRQIGYNV